MLAVANMYFINGLVEEAMHAYAIILKNKQFSQAGRLRLNMGNIYFSQNKYPQAIKMYRMALDQVCNQKIIHICVLGKKVRPRLSTEWAICLIQIPNTSKELRYRAMRNIGNAFMKLGQYQDALQTYETIMEGFPDHLTGFNLLVCYYALGDKDKMKKAFMKLVSIQPYELLTEGGGGYLSEGTRLVIYARSWGIFPQKIQRSSINPPPFF